jgi:TetR/AcrR family transcriptional regulator
VTTTQRSRESTTRRNRDGRRPDIAQEILVAARQLIEEKGASFTIHEVTKKAGVALQTFYRYYAGKDQLFLAAIQSLISEHCMLLEATAQSTDDPAERLRLYVTASLGSLQADIGEGGPRFIASEHWRLLQFDPEGMNAATKPFADLVQRELEAAQAAGTLAPRDPTRDAWMITKLVIAVFHHYAFVPDDPGVTTAGDDVWHFCLAAVQGPTEPSRRRGFARRRR